MHEPLVRNGPQFNLSPHRLRQYRALSVFMQTGSVTQAAEVLCVSQPAVTRLLRSLETDLGIALFVRARRRVSPTAEAVRLHREVEELLRSANRVERVVSHIRGAGIGELRVASLPMLGMRFLPGVLARFREQKRSVYFSLHVTTSSQVRAAILSGEADVGFAHTSQGEEELQREALPPVPGFALLSAGHRLASRDSLTPQDFEGEDFVSLNRENRVSDLIEELFVSHGVACRPVIQTNLFESACEMVANGMGVSIVDAITASAVGRDLVVKPIVPTTTFPIEILRPLSGVPSTLLTEFIGAFRVELAARLSQV